MQGRLRVVSNCRRADPSHHAGGGCRRRGCRRSRTQDRSTGTDCSRARSAGGRYRAADAVRSAAATGRAVRSPADAESRGAGIAWRLRRALPSRLRTRVTRLTASASASGERISRTTGSRRIAAANSRTSSVQMAESRTVWRGPLSPSTMRCTSRRKRMSRMRSAPSTISSSTCSSSAVPLARWSSSRPGRRDEYVDSLGERLGLRRVIGPALHEQRGQPQRLERLAQSRLDARRDLTRRHHDQHAHRARDAGPRLRLQALDHRRRERCDTVAIVRLDSEHVTPGSYGDTRIRLQRPAGLRVGFGRTADHLRVGRGTLHRHVADVSIAGSNGRLAPPATVVVHVSFGKPRRPSRGAAWRAKKVRFMNGSSSSPADP